MTLTLDALLKAEPSWDTQLALVVIWGVIWFFGIPFFATRLIAPFIRSQPWCSQWSALWKDTLKKSYFIEFERSEQVFVFACEFVAYNLQHGVGGALCIPSLLGYRGPLINTLAAHGALCEAGWEFEDTFVKLYERFCAGEEGRKKTPVPLLVLVGLHHSLGLAMVVPMNVYYQYLPVYHEFIFLLQFAALIALLSQNYGYTLDVKTMAGLSRMRIAVFITLVVMLWSRGVRYVMIGYELMTTFIADNNLYCMYAGGTVLGTMGFLNVLFIGDAIAKFRKFVTITLDNIEDDYAVGSFVQ